MRKTTWRNNLAFIGGVAFYIGLALLFSAYDNYTMHRSMNNVLFERFVDVVKSKFSDYQISTRTEIRGEAVTQPGSLIITQGDSALTAEKWIIHGGYSADEPEWTQALRHFYDPLSIDGGAYHLTNNLPPGVNNPMVNSLDWSLEIDGEIMHGLSGKEGLPQYYSWRDGQASFAQAMLETDFVTQQAYMAHAWRCLGESMHCLADMVCPVHTRNDGHPPQYDPDPYEDAIRGNQYLPSNPEAFWDQDLVEFARNSDDIFQIYHKTALFTNNNFFTNQTIYGDGVGPIKPYVRPSNPYPEPYARESGDGWEYDPLDFTFYKMINNQRIKMCKDRYYFAGIGSNFRTTKAYVDIDVAESQAQVLLSNFLGVGPHLMAKYLPVIRVELETINADDESIWGFVEVKEENGYPEEVIYESHVNITNLSTGESVETTAYGGGWYNSDELEFSEGDQIQAQISIGGLLVYSEKVTVGGSIYEPYIQTADNIDLTFELLKIKLSNGDVIRDYISSDLVVPPTLSLNGRILTSENTYSQTDETHVRNFVFEFDESFRNILRATGEVYTLIEDSRVKREYSASFEIENIHHKYHSGIPGLKDAFIWYQEDDSGHLKDNLKSFEYSTYYLNKVTMESETLNATGVDWSTDSGEANQFSVSFTKL